MHYAGYNLSKIKINNIFNNIQRIFPKEQPKQQKSGFFGWVAKVANFINNLFPPKSQLEIQINSFITHPFERKIYYNKLLPAIMLLYCIFPITM